MSWKHIRNNCSHCGECKGGNTTEGIYTHRESDRFITVDAVGLSSIDKAVQLLAGIESGASRAVSSALKRATSSGAMLAQKEIRTEYVLTASTFKAYTDTKRHYVTDADGTTVEITFAGVHIPLMKFDASVNSSGVVSARVKRSNARGTLEHAFSRTVGKHGHQGIFEHTAERYKNGNAKMRELFGPSVPQMINYNEEISAEIRDRIREKFDERLEHEILAVLNGWNTGRGGGLR